MNKKRNLRALIVRFNVIVLLVICVMLFGYSILNANTIDKYNHAFQQYHEVSLIYSSFEESNNHLKDYLYTSQENSWKLYEEGMDKAILNTKSLEQSNEIKEPWRIHILYNMLTYYETQAEEARRIFQEGGSDYAKKYSDLLFSYELISKTSDNYYRMLTADMEEQSRELTSNKQFISILSVTMALFTLCWLACFTYITINAITKPLQEILKNIHRVRQGEYDLAEDDNTSEEMQELCIALNDMAKAVRNEIVMTKENALLEKQLLETANENLKKDELLAQSEVKMLQNQINPHFLFNTLNMAYRLALQEGAKDTGEMIARTSALLRYGLDKQNRLSDLQSEIDAAKNYILIQEKRLQNYIKFILHVDKEFPNISIPGMILQPLIENSIKHGLQHCVADGEILVSLTYVDHFVYLQISDNGEGMDTEQLDTMLMDGFKNTSNNHLGLYNVWKRLEMFFQDRVDISMNSAIGCGFECTIRIEVQDETETM